MTGGPYDWSRVFARAPEGLTVSAIVVSYRTGVVLFDCLHALLADPDVSEVVVVDNGNPPETMARLEALWQATETLRVVGDGVNRGFAAGVNLGAEHATSERLLILNPDALLRPGSIAALEEAYKVGAEPVIAGGLIYGADGVEQRGSRRRTLSLSTAAATFLGLARAPILRRWFRNINRNDEPMPEGPVPMEAVSGAFMYMSRRGFDRLNGFDAGYFLHVEDLDLCRRAKQEGGSVVFTPLAGAYHYGATSDAPKTEVEHHKAAGISRYLVKFAKSPAERLLARLLGPVISLALYARVQWRSRTAD